MEVDVRRLSSNEVEAMLPLAVQFYAEGFLPGKFNGDRFCNFWSTLIENGMGIVLAAWDGFELVGVLGSIIVDSPTTGDRELHEMFWFMSSEARGKGAGRALMESWMEGAKKMGVKRVMMVRLCDEAGEALDTKLKQIGFQPLEVHYSMEV